MYNMKKNEAKEINEIQAEKDNPGIADNELDEVTGGADFQKFCTECGKPYSECDCKHFYRISH